MGMNELRKAMEIIQNSGAADFEGEKDEDLVLKAEKYLGVRFPPTYREFLKTLGCGDIDGKEFYGLINERFENSSVPNAIWLTSNLRRKYGTPPTLVFIAESAEGYYALDLGQTGPEGEAAVVDWNAGKGKGPYEIVFRDFGAFLLESLNE
jgi:hypothetical protein